MKRFKILWIATMLLAIGTVSMAQVGTKHKVDNLYYEIKSTSPREVKVVPELDADPFWSAGNKPMGDIVIPDSVPINSEYYSVTEIGINGLSDCNITSVFIPKSVIAYNWTAFNRCPSITAINVAAENPRFSSEDGVFFNKDKTKLLRYPTNKPVSSYTVPESVDTLGNSSMSGATNLIEIILPEGLIFIDNNVFWSTTNLRSIKIPSGVTTIGDRAFYNCKNLKYISADIPDLTKLWTTDRAFELVPKGSDANPCKLFVPSGKKSAYSSRMPWQEFSPNIYELNMSRKIDLKVTTGQQIGINLATIADFTSIRIISGSLDSIITVNADYNGWKYFTAGSQDMSIYGDIKWLYLDNESEGGNNGDKIQEVNASGSGMLTELVCQNLTALTKINVSNNALDSLNVSGCTALEELYLDNNAELDLASIDTLNNCTALKKLGISNCNFSSLDVSTLTELRYLNCAGNNFTTKTLNELYCSLPLREEVDNAVIVPIAHEPQPQSPDTIITNTNGQIARDKHWKVQCNNGTDLVTTGAGYCVVHATVTTGDATLLKETSAFLNGSVIPGTEAITERGFEWKKTSDGSYQDLTSTGTSDNFGAKLTGLDPSTNYTYRAYVKEDAGKIYGEEKTFTTKDATNYNIRIAETELTSANTGAIDSTNFPNLNITKGTITYDLATKTMTLNGVEASTNRSNLIHFYDEEEGKLVLIGTNTITSSGNGIRVDSVLTIEGDGSLKATSTNYCGLNVRGTLTIKNTTVEAIGKWAISGSTDSDRECLIIENSTVKATGSSISMGPFHQFILQDCGIVQPKGATIETYDSNGKAVMLNGEVVASEVVIMRVPATVTTGDVYVDLPSASAILNGSVDPGTDVITERGFEWKETTGGTYQDLISEDAGNTFGAELIGLTPDTSYTYRAYVKVAADTEKIYGAEKMFITIDPVGIENITQAVTLYPNPANNVIMVETEAIGSTITITDLSGRTVMTATVTDSKTTLDIHHLSAGTYVARVGDRMVKVVKM
ncbi:MAG: Leucine Rich repeats (2 copies) [Bacteroidetes bacterium ADurb.Bin174]|nr:MAG: Leucine Rich repeats (2 copies) [Bacteroidetes bacterium ADurb.Bin174]